MKLNEYLDQVKKRLDLAMENPDMVGNDPYRGGITNLGELHINVPTDLIKLIKIIEVLSRELNWYANADGIIHNAVLLIHNTDKARQALIDVENIVSDK